MIRHQDNTIKVLYNRCPHRGAEIVRDVHGCAGTSFDVHTTRGRLTQMAVCGVYQSERDTIILVSDRHTPPRGMTAVAAMHVHREWVFCRLAEEGEDFETFFWRLTLNNR